MKLLKNVSLSSLSKCEILKRYQRCGKKKKILSTSKELKGAVLTESIVLVVSRAQAQSTWKSFKSPMLIS